MDRRGFLRALGVGVAALQVQPQEALEQIGAMVPPPTAPEIGAFAEAAGFPGVMDIEELIMQMMARRFAEDIDRDLMKGTLGSGMGHTARVPEGVITAESTVEYKPVYMKVGFTFGRKGSSSDG